MALGKESISLGLLFGRLKFGRFNRILYCRRDHFLHRALGGTAFGKGLRGSLYNIGVAGSLCSK